MAQELSAQDLRAAATSDLSRVLRMKTKHVQPLKREIAKGAPLLEDVFPPPKQVIDRLLEPLYELRLRLIETKSTRGIVPCFRAERSLIRMCLGLVLESIRKERTVTAYAGEKYFRDRASAGIPRYLEILECDAPVEVGAGTAQLPFYLWDLPKRFLPGENGRHVISLTALFTHLKRSGIVRFPERRREDSKSREPRITEILATD